MKPATAKTSCKMPETNLRPRIEPSPGVASWLMINQLHAALRRGASRPGGTGQVFIGAHHCGEGDGQSEQDAHAAGQQSGHLDQSANDEETKDRPPMFAHHL